MKRRLSDQIQDLIDLVLAAADQAEDMQQALGAELASFGLTLTQFDDDIAHLVTHLLQMKAVAKRHEDEAADNQGENGSRSA